MARLATGPRKRQSGRYSVWPWCEAATRNGNLARKGSKELNNKNILFSFANYQTFPKRVAIEGPETGSGQFRTVLNCSIIQKLEKILRYRRYILWNAVFTCYILCVFFNEQIVLFRIFQITETYAFLPREAVTRFLMGCLDCQRRPRSLSPPAPLGLPHGTTGRSRSPTILPNGFHQLAPLPGKPLDHHLTKNGIREKSTKNWENEIDASQPALKISFTDGLAAFDTTGERSLRYLNPSQDMFSERTNTNGIDLTNTLHPIPNGISPNKIGLFESGLSAFRSVRKDVNKEDIFDFNNSEEIDTGEAKTEPYISGKSSHSTIESQRVEIKADRKDEQQNCEVIKKICAKTSQEEAIQVSEKPKKKPAEKEAQRKPYNPLDVCNLTSKDPPKSRTPPKKRLHPIFNKIEENGVESRSFSKAWSPSMQSMFSPHRLSTEGLGSNQKAFLHGVEIDYSVPITTTYLKHMRSLGYSAEESMKISNKVGF